MKLSENVWIAIREMVEEVGYKGENHTYRVVDTRSIMVVLDYPVVRIYVDGPE